MLPPFRVRCLQRSACSGRGIQKKNVFDALVRISAPEYDNTIRVCPEASLKYLDDDDGETITVGSSLELIQRLESPLRDNFQVLPSVKTLHKSSDQLNFTEDGPCPSIRDCHTFSIECRASPLEIWREIKRRSEERGDMLQPSNCSRSLETGALSKNERDLLLPNRELLGNTASPISSYRSMVAEDLCADDLKVHVDESDDVSRLQELEDYRSAYFQASNPPQSKPLSSALVSREIEREHNSEMSYSFVENPPFACAMAYPAVNLTLEGKRQAQAAGDKLRARTTPSRRKREIATSFDQTGYQNRWASYNDPTSSFQHGNLSGFNQLSNEPRISSDGKRQPQLAGDKLRCRTNPVRHAKSLRGPTDYGVNKNRRCSPAGLRVIHGNDRAEPSRSIESLEAARQGKIEMQPSLLQVFEAELAKLSSNPSPTEYKEVITKLGLPHKRPLEPSSPEPYLSAEEAIRNAQTLNGMGPMGPQPCVQVLEIALRATLGTLATCVTQIANCVQEVRATIRLTDQTREIDTQVLDNAVAGFRSFREDIATLEKVLQREPESNEESRAKIDRREDFSSLQDDQALKSSCTVILWPIPREVESNEIQDILLLHTNQVKSVFISEGSERGLRLAFCAVKDDRSAQVISRKMAGQMLGGNRLNVVIASAPKDGSVCEEDDVFEKLALQKHPPSLDLQNQSTTASPSTTSLPAPVVDTSGTIDAVEERNQNMKSATTNLTFADRSSWRSDSKPAKPVSLLSNYARSGNRLRISDRATGSVETATQVDRRGSNPQIYSTHSGAMQPNFKDTASTYPDLAKGITFDSKELSCSYLGSSPRKMLRPASIVPLHNPTTHLLRYHESEPLHVGQDVTVLDGSSSPQNQTCSKSHPASSCSGLLPADEWVDKLDPPPVRCTPLTSVPDLSGVESIGSLGQSPLKSAQSNVKDQLNPLTISVMPGQKNAVRACRSLGTLFQRDDPIDHGQSQAGEVITGKEGSKYAPLGPSLARMPTEPSRKNFQDKTDLPNCGVRSQTGLKYFQALGSSSNSFSLQDNADVKQSSTRAFFSDQSALSRGLDEPPPISPLTSRFPTLEQFEGRHFDSASRFPATPNTIFLTDPRPRAQSTGAQSLKPRDSSPFGANSSDSAMLEKWNDEKQLIAAAPESRESSGEFFNRMTRLAGKSMTYHLPSTSSSERDSTGSCDPVARKYSSHVNTATAHRTRLTHNLRRSSTTAGLNDTPVRNNRRPYSENFSGNGRVTWDSFLHKDDKNMENYPKDLATATKQEAQTARSVFGGRAAFASEDEEFDEAASEMRDFSFAGEHSDAASVRKIQECVSQLQVLGFGGDVDEGIRRLVVYAQAAEGDLAGAIDMIDEEQRAYKERNSRM